MDYAVNTYDLYRDIQQRTGGEIYIGVLGPVRTGKSTFIKRFMDEMVLPYMEDEHARMRAQECRRKDYYNYGTEVHSQRGGKGEIK